MGLRPPRETVAPSQGEGPQVISFKISVRTEALDLMRDPRRELEHLGKLAAAEPTKWFGKLKTKTRSYRRAGCSEELPAQF